MALIYSPKIVTDGLVFCADAGNKKSYPGSGTTWFDLSGNGTNLILINGPSYSSLNGGIINLDGINDYVVGSSNLSILNGITGSDGFTCSVLFKLNNYSTSTTDPATSFQGSSLLMKNSFSPSWGISLTQSSPNASRVFTRADISAGLRNTDVGIGNPGYGSVQVGSIISVNTWYKIDLTHSFAGTTHSLKLYLNGSLAQESSQTSATFPILIQNTGSVSLGFNPIGSLPIRIDASFASCNIYNRSLSAAEILQNYNAVKSRFGL